MNGFKKVFKNYSKGYYGNNNKFSKNQQMHKQNDTNIKDLTSQQFSRELEYVKTIDEHNTKINNIICLNNKIYLTSDSGKFYIRTLEETSNIYNKNIENNAKIGKIIYSSGKIIFTAEYSNQINGKDEKGISHKIFLMIFNNNNINNNNTINNNQIQIFSCITNDKPIDILESDNIIITVGKNCIELFQFNQNNNNPITKVSEILFNNNNDEKYKILCVQRLEKYLICGHASGHISLWEPINEYPFLKNILISKIHMGSINKIICDKNSQNLNVIITCSSDKTVKVHSVEDTICFKVLDYEDEVMDIKKVLDYEKQINYIISLKNGIIKVYNSTFKQIFDIPSRSNAKTTRFVLSLSISSNNNNEENNELYLLVTEENKINIYKWNRKVRNNNNNKNYVKKWNNKYY